MKNKTEYHFKYKPLPHEIGCNLEFIVADKDGENKVGLLVFQEGINGVQAVVGCNGSSSVMESNGFCQSKFGLYQSLKFYKEVVSANEENCPKGKGKNWLFEMPLGSNECVFMELESKEMFTLQTYGWDRILLDKE